MNRFTKLEIWTRYFIYGSLAITSHLLADESFRHMVEPVILTVLGCVNDLMLVWRTFIDQSLSQGQDKTPVPIINADDKPLKTEEVPTKQSEPGDEPQGDN